METLTKEKAVFEGTEPGFSFWYDIEDYLSDSGEDSLTSEIEDTLREEASDRALSMMREGYSQGELCCNYYDHETNTEHEFRGWWRAK